MPTTYAGSIKEWRELTASVVANEDELPELEIQTAALQRTLEEMLELLTQQALYQRTKQEASKRLRFLQDEGDKLATVIRVTLRQHYGRRSEKLVEFRLKPFRGLKRTEPVSPPAPPEPPEDPGTPPEVEIAMPDPSLDPTE